MNPVLLLPAGLAALAALALPLLLHLARREDRRPVDFAALRWLAERVRPRRSLRFEEPLLLALRLLLVALLALLLARPALDADAARTPWIVAAPGIGADALRTATAGERDAAAERDAASERNAAGEPDLTAERRWLAPGFPPVDGAPPGVDAASLASLLRELDMRMPPDAPLTVLVPPVLDGMDAERPRLSRPVDWRVVGEPAPPGAGDPTAAPSPPRLVFLRDDDSAPYLRAVADAWQAQQASGATVAGPEIRVWTSPAPLPAAERAWVEAGGTVLLAHDAHVGSDVGTRTDSGRDNGTGPGDGTGNGPGDGTDTGTAAATLWTDPDGRPLLRARRLGAGRILQWMRPLDPAVFPALLEADFPDRLRDAIQPPATPGRVLAIEHAPVLADIGPWPAALRDLRPWLAVLVALLFLLERWLAAGPRGTVSAAEAAGTTRARAPQEPPA